MMNDPARRQAAKNKIEIVNKKMDMSSISFCFLLRYSILVPYPKYKRLTSTRVFLTLTAAD